MAYKSKFMQQLEQQGKLSAVSEQTTGETASASVTTENYKSSFMKKLQSRGQLKETDGSTETAVTPAPMRSPTDRSYTDDTQSLSTTTASTGADSAYKTEVSGIKVQEAENKLAELSAKMEEVRQQGAALLENRKKLATAKQGLAQLNAQYNASGDETTAQAYLLATEEYQKLREETQKASDAYEKNTSVYTDYEKANLDYQKAYADYQQQEQEYQQYLDDHPEEKYKGAQLQTLEQVLENLKAEKTALIQTGEAVDWEAVDKVNGKIDTVEGMIQTKKQNSDTSLWGSSGKDFFNSIMSGIQAGQLDWFAGMEQVDRKVGNAALGLAADWLSGVAKITKNENLLQTATQWKEQSHSESEGAKEALAGSQQAMNEALAGAGKIDGWIIQQMQSIGSMMMDSWMMGTSELYNPGTQNLQVGKTLSGGTTQPSGTLGSNGKLKQAANKVWSALDPSDGLSSLKIMAMRAGGTAMLQAQEEGKSETEQILIGIANGALEYVSEKMFGGSPAYDVDKGWVTKAVEKVTQNPTILRLLYSDGFDIFGEGIEEVFTGITEPIAEGLITGDEIEITADELINSFAGGVFLSLVGQGSNIVVREVSGAGHKQRSAERKAGQIVTNAEAVQDLVNKGLAAAPESEAYRKAEKLQKKLDKNKTISNREVGQQLFANQEAIEAGQLVDDTEVAPNENAPEGALHDPEDGVYAIGVLTDKTGKKETTMYQLLQITENGSVRTIGDPVNGLLAAKLGAESRGANVRYVGSIYEIREAMLTQAEEAQSATEAAEAGNDGETGENGTEAEAAGQEWAGEQNAKDEAQNPSVSEADSSAQGTPYGRPDLSGEPLGEQVTTETAEETVPDLQWAGNTEAQTDRGENAANSDTTEAEASGIQWAGNEYEEVTNNEAKQQKQRDVGARGDQQGQRGNETVGSERSQSSRRADAAIRRTKAANRIRAYARASGNGYQSLIELGVREGSEMQNLILLDRDSDPDIAEAYKIVEANGCELIPVSGMMYVLEDGEEFAVSGIQNGNKIWAQADSIHDSLHQIIMHELYHNKSKKDKKLNYRLAKWVVQTYGEQELMSRFNRYYEKYQEIYRGKGTDRTIKELCMDEMFADMYAEIERYGIELLPGASEATQNFIDKSAQSQKAQSQTEGQRYSIAETEDGQLVAVVDNDILSHIDTSVWNKETKAEAQKAAKEALMKFQNGIVLNDVTYKINRNSRREYTRSNDTERLYRKNKDAFSDKMRSAKNVDDVIVATTDWVRDGELKHPRTDNFVDFTKGTLLIQSGENQYEARTVVGITNIGEYVFYDLVDMEPTSFKTKGELSSAVSNKNAVNDILESSPENSISDFGETVNRYSVASEDKAQQRAERELAKGIGEIMSMPNQAVRQIQTGLVRDIIEEYRQTGDLNMEKLEDAAATAFAQGLQIDNEFYERYKDLKTKLRTTAVTIAQQDQADIADYTQFKKRAFGTLRIVGQGGTPVDTLYQELVETAPELFSADITHPADQLVRMYEVAREIKRVETPLERALGEQSDRFYEWAEKKITALADRVLTKYADSVSWDQKKETQRGRTGQRTETDSAGTGALTQDELERRRSGEQNSQYVAPRGSNLRGGQREMGNWQEEQPEFKPAESGIEWAGQEQMTDWQQQYPEYEFQGYDPSEQFEQDMVDDFRPEEAEERTQEERQTIQQWIDYVMGTKDGWKEFAAGVRKDLQNRKAFSNETKERIMQRELPPGVEPPAPEDAEVVRRAMERAEKAREEASTASETADAMIIPKKAFTSTPAMEKLGIKIDGSVTRYRSTEMLRAYDRAAQKTQRMLNRRMSKLNATRQEIALAKGLVRGEVTVEMLNQNTVDLDKVTELADYMGAMEGFNNDRLSQRRAEINVTNLKIAQELLKDSDAYAPRLKGKLGDFTKIVMNERTPERVVKQIFGEEQGGKIYETYFRPVWVNGAEMSRFENRMLQRVAEFTDQNGLKRQLTEDERAMAQRLLEGEAVRMRMDELEKQDPDSRQRIEDAATNVNNGMDWVDAANDQNLQEEELRGLVQAYADYMDTVSVSQDMDQTILQNAIREYQTIYNEMYEAMNDFLVSHGYNEIGFIKGYAPHFQKAEVQNGLFGALKNLGVENTKVSALPTEIAGRTADFKPNMKWNPHMQSRKGSSTDYDILKGYEQYLHYAAEMFYHTDDVMRVRQAVNFMRSQFAADEITQAIEDAGIDSYKNAAWKREFLTRKEKLNPMGDYSDAEINAAYQKYVDELFEKAKPDKLKKYSEFTSWMDNYANILAGKQSYADRGTEYSVDRKALNIGRKVMKAFSEVNVAGNLSTVLNQSAQLPLIQTELGLYLERAAISMIRGDMAKENFADRSDFLTDKRGVDKLTTDNYEKVISALFKPAEMMDRMVSTLAVRGKYLQVYDQLKAKGIEGEEAIEQAMREADDFGRRVMGSRMKGAKPLAFESKQFISQMIHVFQVESSNTLDYMLYSEMPQAVKETYQKKGKAAAARYATAVAMKYLTGAFIMNLLTDTLYGGSPAPFDIMGWALNFVAGGWSMDDEEFLKTIIDNGWEKLFGSRIFDTEQLDREEGFQWAGSMDDLAYNIMGDVPYLRNVMGVLGLGDQSLPTVGINEAWNSLVDAGQTLWQQATEPEETGLDWAGAAGRVGQDLFDVATEFIPGGRQLQKTATGISAMVRGGKYSGYGENSRLQYPVEQNVWNSIRAGLFGLSALPESNAYYAGGTALTAAQTSKAQALEEQGVDIQQTYDLYQEFADINKQLNKERITSIEARAMKRDAIDDMDLTDEQKLEVYLETMAANSDTAREKYQALLDTGVSWQQLTQLDNDYASFNVDSDEDGVDDMTSLEKGIAKRNAINDMDLTDAQKLEVYDWYHMDQDSDNYEATRTEFEAMLNEGLTWDEITQAHNMYATLNADEELNATQKATQYAKWADEQDWNTDQIAAVKERYTFWQMIPAEASTYEKFTGAGLGTDSAEEVTNILAALEPESDKENVTTSQKVLAIYNSKLTDGEKTSAIAALASERKERFVEAGVSENTSESLAAQIAVAEAENGEDELNYLEKARIVVDTADNDQAMAALSAVLNESTYAKVEIASYYGVKAGEWVTFREEWLDMYGEDSMSQEKVQNVLDRMNLSTEAKAALWQISNKSWKPKNNPYSTGVGQWIYGELNTEG